MLGQITTIVNFLMVLVKIFQYFMRKKKLQIDEIERIQKAFKEYGFDESATPEKIKQKFKDQKERMKLLLKRKRGEK